ncbi:alpha-2-macroglobulin family protein [Candidatus Poribacteria bacterium]|nr:alpha-2-macroglobulin family protein [Candidatus Poribacteria bacterium]MYH81592.1 alpha-2-macroglobulin family protein [Candidatus Poribacteria bacterium]
MVFSKLSKNLSAEPENRNLLLKSLIGVIGLMTLLLGACLFYIVRGNVGAKTRYSVNTFAPQGEVGQWTDFSITFSEGIVDKSRVGTEVPAEALRFTPAVQGTARWVAPDRIGFFLDAALAPAAQYTVKLTSEINPSEVFQLTGQKEFKFATEPFAVQQTRMEFNTDESREHAIGFGTITFNYPVTTADLKAHLSIELDDGTEIPYQIQTNTVTARTITFETKRIKRSDVNQKIKVKIEKGFKCTGGEIGLEKANVTPVILRGRGTLGVTYSDVRESDGTPYISVSFNAPVLSDTLEPYLEVTPAVAYQVTSNYRNIRIHGNFKRRTTYTLKIRRGLTARNDAVLKGDYMTRFRIPDIRPQLRFLGDGFFLARKGHLNLGLTTINVKRVKLNIEKVFANNLIYVSRLDRWSRWSRNLGKPIHSEVLDIPPQLNEEVTTPISLEAYLADEHVGIFKVVAQNADRQWDGAHQWVLITDLGISAKRAGDNLYVWVKSIATGAPVPAARVQLISNNNQTLLSGTTNWAGFAEFTEVAEKTEDFLPFMITVAKRDDLAFIQLDRHEIATADFDIAGPAYLQKGYEAFLYTSRGVYRPGETVQLAGVVRGPKQVTPEPIPTRIKILSPDGRIMRELRQQTNKSGACEVKIPIPDYALTGNYIAKMQIADRVVGSVQFQVEEFMPDRMKVAITVDKPSYKLGDELSIEINAMNLFGPPAVGRKTQASCQLQAVPFVVSDDALPPGTDAAKWRSFVFGNTRQFESQRIELGEAKTDATGKARYQLTVPATLKAPSLLNGILTATVSEVGGRAVTASHRVVIHPYSHYAGVRRATTGEVKINQPLRFDYVAVDDAMTITPDRALKLSLHKVHWNTILRQNAAGRYAYVSEPQMTEVKTYALTSGETAQTATFTPTGYGEYRVRLEDIESTATAEIGFYVSGWRNTPVSMEHPTRLDLVLDKPAYRPGQTAKLNIKAPFPGTLLLTVERERVLSHRTIVMKENTATVSIPVRYSYKPNVYLSATLTRTIPMDTVSQPNNKSLLPARAFGVIPLKIDATRRRLAIEMSLKANSDQQERTPLTDHRGEPISDGFQSEAIVRPNSEINIAFEVHGRRSWQKYDVCIAAVDEGILALTDFQTPNPHDFFYQQRGLKTRAFDLYSGILPEIADVTDNSSTGGDGAAARRLGRKRLNTSSIRRVKPVSLWSGFVQTDGNGRGTVQFKIPQFNGKLRLMAVAFAGADYGATEAYLTVREPIVLTPTFPRFLAGGDKIRVPVTLFNGTGEVGEFTVKLRGSGDVQLLSASTRNTSETMPENTPEKPAQTPKMEPPLYELSVEKTVEAGTEAQVFFDIRAQDALGEVNFNLSAEGNTETTQMDVKLPLRSVAPPVTKTGHGVISAGEPVDFILPSNLIADSSEFSLTLSPFPNIAFSDSLRYLVRYPHGCLEQTTSKVFPLLYFSDLARSVEPMLAAEDSVDHYITAGITKLESMLMSNNEFSYWPGGTYANPWSSIYASHFLVEARKAGYEVADRVYDAMLEGLKTRAKFSPDTEGENDAKKVRANIALATYASYVLAAAGQPDHGTMHYLKNRGASGLSDYSHFQLAGTFALSGELETALSMLPVSVSLSFNGKGNPGWETGGTFNSPIRAQAIMLDVLAEVNENHPSIPMLVKNLSEAASGGNRWRTTQDNAFAFLALGKIMKKQADRNYSGTLKLNGEHFADFDATETRYTDAAWDGARIQLNIEGEGSCYYYWSAFGIQRDSFIEEYERELQVRRRYFNKDGEELTGTFVHGDLIVSEITVKALTANLENVVVVDMLPTGFEIENPRLESRAGIPWLKAQGFKPDYIDIRDDRLIFFGTFPRQRERKFYYALRAVTQGEFTLPPIAAEAMYDPTKSAVTGSMSIKVVTE